MVKILLLLLALSGTDHLIGNASLQGNRASLPSTTCQASAGALAAQCRCIGCPVPVYWLPSAGVLAAQCRCIGCAVPVYWLRSAGVLAAQCRCIGCAVPYSVQRKVM